MFQSTSEWIALAEKIWEMCKEAREANTQSLTDQQILDAVLDAAKHASNAGDHREMMLLGALTVPTDGQLTCTCLYRWAEGAYPTVEIGEKFAASLLVSSLSDEVLETVKMPWPGISIIVPGDILQVYEPTLKKNVPIRRIFASVAVGRKYVTDGSLNAIAGNWQFIGMATEALSLWRFGVTPRGMLLESDNMLLDAPKDGLYEFNMEHTDIDSRTAGLIGKLVVMTCVALTMKEMVTERVKPQGKKKKKRENKEGPSARFFTVGKPIVLDFRERVKSYMLGTRQSKELNIQFMVAGHFKQQAFGEKRAQRKTIWIEPYWKGDETAAIPVRSHVVK